MSSITVSRAPALAIGSVSKRTGIGIETIRYYERIGLLPSLPRRDGGHRVYSQDHLKRLMFIRRCRELNFSLKEIRELLGLVDRGQYTCAEVQAIALTHLTDVARKILSLQRLKRTLTQVAEKCTGRTVPDCPLIDALFENGQEQSRAKS